MATSHTIRGGGNLSLHVREWGDPDAPPILFIHGWSASHMAWTYQYESALADKFRLVAPDLRGHGMSDKPADAEHYTDGRRWADDIEAIIEALGLSRPVLVGWSYGGFVMCDYVRAYGTSKVSALNFVGGGVTLNEVVLPTLYGPGFLGHIEGATQPDLPTNIEAMRQFVRELVAVPMSVVDHERALAFNIVVPPYVRANMLQRDIDSDDVLASMDVPVLVTHGTLDRHALPAMAEHIGEVCPSATLSWYEGVAHMPFMESHERFNTELAELARGARAQ